jgi:protoporphyrinogen oxidase
VESIGIEDDRVEGVTFTEGGATKNLKCEYLVSTIPVTELAGLLRGFLRGDLHDKVRSLRFRAVLLCCLVVRKKEVFPSQMIYFTNRFFNRLSQMNSFSPFIFPEGKTGLVAEITCDEGDDIWNMPDSSVAKEVIDDLIKEGFAGEDDIEECLVLRNPYGYPIMEIGYQEILIALMNRFSKIDNLLTGGRQGSFNYVQMNFALMAGIKMAEHIISGKSKNEVDSSIYDLRYYF